MALQQFKASVEVTQKEWSKKNRRRAEDRIPSSTNYFKGSAQGARGRAIPKRGRVPYKEEFAKISGRESKGRKFGPTQLSCFSIRFSSTRGLSSANLASAGESRRELRPDCAPYGSLGPAVSNKNTVGHFKGRPPRALWCRGV